MATITESLIEHVADMTPYNKAKYIAPKMRDLIAEAERKRLSAETLNQPVHAELAEYEKATLSIALELLEVLSIEQWRQREAIKHYLGGNGDRAFLRRISDSWNGDKTE